MRSYAFFKNVVIYYNNICMFKVLLKMLMLLGIRIKVEIA